MHVLIVDDDSAFRGSLAETLGDLGCATVEAGSVRQALTRLRAQRFDAVFLDCRMPDSDGMELLRDIRAEPSWQSLSVFVLTGFATPGNTIEAMRLGAIDHVTKPVSRQQLADMLERVLPADVEPSTPSSIDASPYPLIGESAEMRVVQKQIGIAAASDCTVLVRGETGTGKDVVARLIHAHSDRSAKPFIALNCAAVPGELLESELFGHVRGAFTGAVSDRAGAFREADGGVLFLDEIGDMEPPMQAKLLRVIEERVVTPVGSDRAIPVDLRLIAATHRDLPARVTAGSFRQDLLYRLDVMAIELPPLRLRGEDVCLLAEHFLAHQKKEMTARARRRLMAHQWPGNVRELRNLCSRAALTARGRLIDANDLRFLDGSAADVPADVAEIMKLQLPDAVRALERMMIEDMLARTGGNKAEAARRLGIGRQLLYAKLSEIDCS